MSPARARTSAAILVAWVVAGCRALPSPPLDAAHASDAGDAGDTSAASDEGAASDAGRAPACVHRAGRPPGYLHPRYGGLRAPARIVRDRLGIAHSYGQSDGDAFFASGYAQATDRLFQMELLRRTAFGTQAALLGAEKLAQDELLRLMNIPRWGRETADLLARERPELLALVAAWCEGVNRRIAEVRAGVAPTPLGLREVVGAPLPAPWTVDDALTVARLILFRNANQLEFDLLATVLRRYAPAAAALPLFQPFREAFVLPPEERPRSGARALPAERLGPGLPDGPRAPGAEPVAWPAPPDFAQRLEAFRERLSVLRSGGSNNWALAGRHTANGRPMLAADPHQPLQSPGVLWPQHLNSADAGGGYDAIGFSFVGTPGVQLGHNRRVAWSATTAYPDTMDLWEVPQRAGAIELAGARLPIVRCTETIEVRGAAPVEYVVEEVAGRGVLLPRDFAPVPVTTGSNRLLFDWVGFRATTDAEVFFDFDRAATLDAFERAVDRSQTASFHFIAASAEGIAYRAHGLVPARGPLAADRLPNAVLDGADPRTLWTGGMLADPLQPRSRGGDRGYLCSANNDPYGFTADGRADNDPFYYGVWFDPGTRARRIERELARLVAAGPVALDALRALQLDTHSEVADALLPTLFDAWERAASQPSLAPLRAEPGNAALLDELRRWDRAMRAEHTAPTVFEALLAFLARRTLGDELGVGFEPVFTGEPVYMHKLVEHTINGRFAGSDALAREGRDALLLGALDDVRRWLAERFPGTDPQRYAWRRYHRTVSRPTFAPAGRFEVAPVETSGSVGTVNVSQAPFFDARLAPLPFHEARAGAVYRMLVRFDDDGTPRAELNFLRGTSGEPDDPHWASAEPDWLRGAYRALPFRRADVEADATATVELRP